MNNKTGEVKSTDFQVSKIEQVIQKYTPLINKLSYQLYSQYSSVIDFNDAKQEVMICLYRCLMKYNSEKATFIAYFKTAVKRLQSRFYHSYYHAININLKTVEVKADEDEDSTLPSFDWLVNRGNTTNPRRLRPLLSKKSQRCYDLFMKERDIHPWLISKKLKLSRYHAQRRYDEFKKELAKVADLGIY
jgi:hypothetical protein